MNIVNLFNDPISNKSGSQIEQTKFINDTQNQENDDIAKDLMILIGNAIDEWAHRYEMEQLPRKIILGQALSIINAWISVMNDNPLWR